MDAVIQPTVDKRTKTESTRSELLGDDPKARCAQLRDALELGFSSSSPGNRKMPTLHQLGSCVKVPDADHVQHRHEGPSMAREAQYACICKVCGKSGSTTQPTCGTETACATPTE